MDRMQRIKILKFYTNPRTWNMSGAFTNSTIVWTASSLASLKVYASSAEKVAKYLVRNLKDSFAELKITNSMRISLLTVNLEKNLHKN